MRPEPTEAQIQRALLSEYRVNRAPCTLLFSIPNQGEERRSRFVVNDLIAQGMLPGAPDLVAVGPIWRQIRFLEVKTSTGHLSPAQRRVHAELREAGFEVAVTYGRDQAELWLRQSGLLRLKRAA